MILLRSARRLAIVLLGLLALTKQSSAQDLDVKYGRDGLILGGSLVAAYLMTKTPVDPKVRWKSEFLGPIDLSVRDNFSPRAARIADVVVGGALVVPLLQLADDGLDRADGRRALLYGETLAVGLLANAVVKYLVQRPRPYTYNRSPRVKAYAKEEGADSRTSFYSGHSSLAFSAATAGTYLFALQSGSKKKRALMSVTQFSLASIAANMRVRAGKHFYSDVTIGALAGSAISYTVLALHADSGGYKPSAQDLAAMGGGVILGALVSELLPLGDEAKSYRAISALQLVPVPYKTGAGFALVGAL